MAGAAVLAIAGAVVGRLAWRATTPRVPAFAAVRAAHVPSDVRLLARDGSLLHEVRRDSGARRLAWTPLDAIAPALVAAVLAAEDRRFFAHGGVDLRALAAAVAARLHGGTPRGASTVTMQLARLLGLAPRGGLEAKWRQVRAARALEARWTKHEILEAYLNLVPVRGELRGVPAAADVLFDVAPHALAPSESAVIAALLRAPGAARASVQSRARRLLRAGTGSDEAEPDGLVAAVERALGAPAPRGARVALAPHLARRLAAVRPGAEALRTTLDPALQRLTVAVVRRTVLGLRDRNVRDAAALVADNASGAVLAYVGGPGALGSAAQVDLVRAPRQAGSTLKPFLYLLALERRLLTAASLLEDTPLDLPVATGLYRPRNYDERFHGPVSVRAALAGSLNIPAVRTLGLLGERAAVDALGRLGFAHVVPSGDHYGPSLALGSPDVTLWQLVTAYRTLANGGVYGPLEVDGDQPPAPGVRLHAEAPAFVVADVLADRESRAATFGLESPLATPFWAAVKTGTSEAMRDNWCVGFTRRHTVGVWVGNASGEPMHDVSGVSGAAPAWLELLLAAEGNRSAGAPPPPAGVVAAAVTFADGGEPARREWFVRGTAPPAAPRRLAPDRPRIVAPVDGAVIAVDPDVPPARHRVALEARTGGRRLRWRVDGVDHGDAGRALLWPPRPGRHQVGLADASGASVDAIRIEVRGAGGAGATPGHRGGNAAVRRLRPNGHEPPRWRRGSRPGTCWPAGVPKRSSRRTG